MLGNSYSARGTIIPFYCKHVGLTSVRLSCTFRKEYDSEFSEHTNISLVLFLIEWD